MTPKLKFIEPEKVPDVEKPRFSPGDLIIGIGAHKESTKLVIKVDQFHVNSNMAQPEWYYMTLVGEEIEPHTCSFIDDWFIKLV